jgi:hypothetical protein
MAERRPPKPSNGSSDLVPIKLYVTVEKWHDLMDRLDKADLKASRYLNLLIDRDELDENGCPAWLPPPPPRPQLSLPGMESTAA